MTWLDHAKLKVAREVKVDAEFAYVFDLGDNWRHRCTVLGEKADPAEEYGSTPKAPVAIWGGARSPISTAGGPWPSSTCELQVSWRWQTTAQPSSMNARCSWSERS